MKNIKLSSLLVGIGISLASFSGCKPSAESVCKDAKEIMGDKWKDETMKSCQADLEKVATKDSKMAETYMAGYKACKDMKGADAQNCVTGLSMSVAMAADPAKAMQNMPGMPGAMPTAPAPAAPAPH